MTKSLDPKNGDGAASPLDSLLLSRRRFLQALAGLSATVVLPQALAVASAPEIEAAWKQASASPLTFEVDESNTITVPGCSEPRVWSDLFDVWDGKPRTAEHLIWQVEAIVPLQSRFQWEADLYCETLEKRAESLHEGSSERRRLEALCAKIRQSDDGWKTWVERQGKAGLDRAWEVIEDWLNESVDWREAEHFPLDWHGQGQAYRFFSALDPDDRRALGVVIVEGEHPGSDYFAAELRRTADDANRAAIARDLPIRFRQGGA